MKLGKYSIPLLVVPLFIFSLGFMSLLSTIPENARSQGTFFVLSAFLYFLFSILDHRLLGMVWKPAFGLTIFFLTLTIILGEIRFGASRWLDLGIVVFQPSEMAKIAVILAVSSMISKEKFKYSSVRDFLKVLVITLPMALLVFFQPDLGTSIVIIATTLGMLFYMGVNKVYFLVMLLSAGIISAPIWNFLKDYQKERILVFLNPNLDRLGMGYNVSQSIIAIGAGQLWGKGFGYGSQSHLRFLPAFWTDFIYASFSEEWGFIGSFVLILLYMVLLFSMLRIAHLVQDPFSKAIGIGIFFVFFVQFTVNVGMNLGLMPVTGIPLPLVSYGGSSLATSMILLGILQNVWIQHKDKPVVTR